MGRTSKSSECERGRPFGKGSPGGAPVALGYIRVSTEDQARDGVSLDAQRERIRAWCAANGRELVGIHVDAGISGFRSANRPGLKAAIADAERRGCGCALVVYSLSRLARNTRECLEMGDRLERAGADLVSLSEKIDTTSAAGKMVFRVMAALAEFERDLISERVGEAMSFARARGQRVGTVPYGWELDESGRRLVENPIEQSVIAEILGMRKSGLSLREIGQTLEERGVVAKSGGRRWHPKVVRDIEVSARTRARTRAA